ncbi:MAG: endonuclease/exonuclease/phosphatase family protein [Candidatus Marinimicrobia bacterium]|nr:endonuclease/exonuclease/phosphatase family protein [Candidatus Neomarinimicrobiota bacterium]
MHQRKKTIFLKMSSAFIQAILIQIFVNLSFTVSAADVTTTKDTVRIALFNIWEMSTEKLTNIDMNGIGQDDQLKAAAEIVRRISPDVLVLNEIDHDIDALQAGQDLSLNARRFNDAYLNQGDKPLTYQFTYAAPCNTGFLAGKDFDNNGKVATVKDQGSREHGGDCYGYGVYPGQYSMAILSRFPLEHEQARTFQKYLWKDLPDNLIPREWYSDDEIEIFRLSSKSHWDVPVRIGKKLVHLLVSHPTPPVFDGPEDRNGRRNYDELKMWVHYINNDTVMVDDSGVRGGLAEDESFIIIGDLNAAPQGDTLETGQRSIDQLLKHPRINDCGDLLVSEGALDGRKPGPPDYIERRTSGWDGRGLRIDHLLPSIDLEPVSGGVYWPDVKIDPDGAALAKKASDHRLIWLDIKVK